MGIDYSAGFADVIEWDTVKEIVPKVAADFLAVIDKHKSVEDAEHVLSGLARCYQFDQEDTNELRSVLNYETDTEENAAIAEIKAAYKSLQSAFSVATSIATTSSNLELGIGYHDSEGQGCRGDEVDGVYWCIDNAYQLSPAGQKFKDKFQRKFFTSWG